MAITIIAIGQKMPAWVDAAYEDYARRIPRSQNVSLELIATAARKSGQTRERIQQQEAEKIRQRIKPGSFSIAG